VCALLQTGLITQDGEERPASRILPADYLQVFAVGPMRGVEHRSAGSGWPQHRLAMTVRANVEHRLPTSTCARCWIGTTIRRLAGLGADCGSGPALRSWA